MRPDKLATSLLTVWYVSTFWRRLSPPYVVQPGQSIGEGSALRLCLRSSSVLRPPQPNFKEPIYAEFVPKLPTMVSSMATRTIPACKWVNFRKSNKSLHWKLNLLNLKEYKWHLYNKRHKRLYKSNGEVERANGLDFVCLIPWGEFEHSGDGTPPTA